MAVKGDGDGRDRVEVLVEEVTERCRRGESPSVGEYEARYPEQAERIRELLPTVLMLEGLRSQKLRTHADAAPAAIPAALGEFRILREIGRGGMGIVYEAEHVALGRRVALKVLPRHSLLEPKRLGRFQREAMAAARLHHTNIVPVLGVGECDGLRYYAMQFIEGCDLRAVLDEWKGSGGIRGRGHWAEVARIGIQAAEALQFAHDQGILHRDVKPANLLRDRHGVVWVTDFGLAKLAEREGLTHTGDIVGTLQYMAPEQFEGRSDARSDVYSLGLTLFELLTLRAAFPGADTSRLVRHADGGVPAPPRKLDPAIPRDLETIVLKAIAREPGRRYATAGALAEDLRRFLDDRPVLARRASPAERLWRWCRRNRAVAALTATAAGSLVAAAAAGWAGYVSTRDALAKESARRDEAQRATRRADQNVALALGAFESLFQAVAPRDDDPPRPGFGGPLPGEDPGGPPPRPPGPGDRGRGASQAEAELLRGILAFYDQFAARNATNVRLQREAAKAYRRAGDLDLRLGRPADADVAYRRAAALLEALVARESAPPGCRYDLAEVDLSIVASTADPLAEGSRLRRALALGEALAAEMPEEPAPQELIAHAHLGLGRLLEAAGRAADAEASLRRALAALEALCAHDGVPPHVGRSRLEAGLALASLLRAQGRPGEARRLLTRQADVWRVFAAEHPRARPARPLLARLDAELRALGADADAADWSEADPGPPPRPPGDDGEMAPPPPPGEFDPPGFPPPY